MDTTDVLKLINSNYNILEKKGLLHDIKYNLFRYYFEETFNSSNNISKIKNNNEDFILNCLKNALYNCLISFLNKNSLNNILKNISCFIIENINKNQDKIFNIKKLVNIIDRCSKRNINKFLSESNPKKVCFDKITNYKKNKYNDKTEANKITNNIIKYNLKNIDNIKLQSKNNYKKNTFSEYSSSYNKTFKDNDLANSSLSKINKFKDFSFNKRLNYYSKEKIKNLIKLNESTENEFNKIYTFTPNIIKSNKNNNNNNSIVSFKNQKIN